MNNIKQIMVGLAGTALAFATTSAQSMTITRHHFASGDTIDLVGDIEHGDAARFHAYLNAIPDPQNVVGFRLNSPGGYINEALTIAGDIAGTRSATVVPDNALCASACFFLFAAGETRFVSTRARVGVHAAATMSGEASATTIDLAKLARKLHIPDHIFVKMVVTNSTGIAWLDDLDLAAMNARVINTTVPQVPGAPSTSTMSAPAAPPAHTMAAPAAPAAPVSTAFADGRRDRLTLQQWANGLGGDYKAGAEYWASVRSTTRPTSCEHKVPESGNEQWMHGCIAARDKLAPFDYRRMSEADYKAGWNQGSSELSEPPTIPPASSNEGHCGNGRPDAPPCIVGDRAP